jgi:hypothetical protein
MSTDTAFGPRQCPACGSENPQEATRCGRCDTPLARPAAITEVPPAPAEEFSLPEPPPKGLRAPLPRYTIVLLAAYGVTLGLYTYGIGLASLLALAPSFRYLYYRAVAPANPFRRPPLAGPAAWATAAGFALLIFLPAGLVAFALAYIVLSWIPSHTWEPIGASFVCFVPIAGLALAAASWPALLCTRRLFPPDAYD